MPTDLCAVLARQRAARREHQANASVMLGVAIVALANVVLLFADHAFAAALAQMGQL